MTRTYILLLALFAFTHLHAQYPASFSMLYNFPLEEWQDMNAPPPLQLEVVQKNIGCKGKELGYIETEPRGGIPPYQWKWSTGATIPGISDLKAGFYQLTITDITGTSIIKDFEIKVISPIAIDFMLSPGENGYKMVEAKVNGGKAPYSYIWNTGDDLPKIRGKEDKTYAVRVIDDNGCQGTRIIDIETSKAEFYEKDFSSLIKIQPNPTDGIITIEYPDKFTHSSSVQLFNNFGQFMRKYPKVPAATKSIEIDLNGLKGGLYFVRIEWAGQSILKKVMLL